MNQESRVFILKVFIVSNRRSHRYPEFSICPIESFSFLSLEDCINTISHYVPDENLYCFVVEAHCCAIDMNIGTKERWLFLQDGTLYSHTFPGADNIERKMEYHGRAAEDCHFKEGDLVEMIDDGTVNLGIVLQQPPTPARVEKVRKELRDIGMPENTIDGDDDRYIILLDTFKDDGNSVYMQCHQHPLASCLLPPSMPVPAKLKKRLQELLGRVKMEKVQHK